MSNGQRTNGLGVGGFVVSLLGFGSCGLISPIGMIMSAVAMKREPKGLAIAGFVIGLIGSLWLIPLFALGLFGVILAAVGVGVAVAEQDNIEAGLELNMLTAEVREYVDASGSPPATLGELSLDAGALTDPWGNPYRLEIAADGSWTVVSDGPDGSAGTDDDVSSDRVAAPG